MLDGPSPDPLASFHPVVAEWFRGRFARPTEAQAQGWSSIAARRPTLVSAPTGSGKTLAAFLSALDGLIRRGLAGGLPDETSVLYVSPLRALSNDIERNLQAPLRELSAALAAAGLPHPEIRTAVRTGDTAPRLRAAATRRPPHVFVTTPESLYIMLTSVGGRNLLRTVDTVIVDEIHALVRDKRGSHLSLSLERLAALCERPPLRIGLSATQRPIDEVARFLVGAGAVDAAGRPDCTVVDTGHDRPLDLALELPGSPLEPVMPHEVWSELYDRIATLAREHATTLVFVNTRRLAERLARNLSERLGEDKVAAHHGALARERRLAAEARLKAGELSVVVATASLELGIDVGAVDLVCQIGSPRAIATFLQRVGRSNHSVSGLPRGRLFPTTRDDLVESAALLDAVRRRELDTVVVPTAPLDILAQQIVAACAAEDWDEDRLFDTLRRAWPYRELSRASFDAVVAMLCEGYGTARGHVGSHLQRDAVGRRLHARRGARILAMTSGGAIPDLADYEVVLQPQGTKIGTINEDFAIESSAGDVFQLGNASWRVAKVEPGRMFVEDAAGMAPTLPFWLGEAPARTVELSHAVGRLRAEVEDALERGGEPAARELVREHCGIEEVAAVQIVEYLAAAKHALGTLPTGERLILERFFDETGGMQMVLHSPLGARINRGFGLALRKRFCQRFDFELQAAATDDAVILSLGPTHSFPLEDVAHYLHADTVREVLVQAVLPAPMFAARFRWNASRALAVPRFRGGKRVAPRLQRMLTDDLLTLVFPDQVACQENRAGGAREVPDNPLVNQTIDDCLHEAMDVDALEELLRDLGAGRRTLLCRDLTEPSPLSAEILTARPYAFLDDAPLEERRTQAVQARRWLPDRLAGSLGQLDASAIDLVREQAFPRPRDVDELHDGLMALGVAHAAELTMDPGWLDALVRAGRAVPGSLDGAAIVVATERIPLLRAVGGRVVLPATVVIPTELDRSWDPGDAARELVRARLECSGPTTSALLAARLGLAPAVTETALLALESEGVSMRGSFDPRMDGEQWCERGLLARIHRHTLDRLRKEIEPVSPADFVRFLQRWQGVTPETRGAGREALRRTLLQLEGFDVAAGVLESEILRGRIRDYEPTWLDELCLAGEVAWLRRLAPGAEAGSRGNVALRSTPITVVRRELAGELSAFAGDERRVSPSSEEGRAVLAWLGERGASFFAEIARGTGLLRTQVERGLAELVAVGAVSCDTMLGLRALLGGSPQRNHPLRRPSHHAPAIERAGRWSIVGGGETEDEDRAIQLWARTLLLRWGVVFRVLLTRERGIPPWGALLRALRRMEAAGEIRGGRFVDGPSGEQFALPEAVGALRQVRNQPSHGACVTVSACDPLNLAGILAGGERLPAIPGNRLLLRDGMAVAVREGKKVHFFVELDAGARWDAEKALIRDPRPAAPA